MADQDQDNVAVVEPPPPAPRAAAPKTDPAKPPPRRQPLYAVVVLNDDDHSFAYVITGLSKVFGYSTEKSFTFAETIDRTGRAVVWTGMLEVAELKRDQIVGLGPDFWSEKPVKYPLGVVLEPLPQ